ncbi:MAG: hypothetical protein KGJ73_11200, partial [Rhodospirillales bacterium]|nr:hypothetical protein [Rhodospirillales bacterium]
MQSHETLSTSLSAPSTETRMPVPETGPVWTVRGKLSRLTYRLIALTSFVLLFAAWWGVTGSGLVDPMFLPGPVAVAKQGYIWATQNDLLSDTGISVYRVVAGFLLSAVMAVP